MNPPLNLERNSRTSGVTPDGRTVPLAWDMTTGVLMMKTHPYMPWSYEDAGAAARSLINAGGVHLADADEWYRGVWVPAPEQILDADYTRDQQRKLLRDGGNTFPQITDGGYSEKSGSMMLDGDEELTPPEEGGDGDDGGEEEEATVAHRPIQAYAVRSKATKKGTNKKDKKKAR